MLTTAIPDNGLKLYCTSYTVRSAVTATVELLVLIRNEFKWSAVVDQRLWLYVTHWLITLSTPLSQLTSAVFLATISWHILYALPTPVCYRSLMSTQPLLPVVSVLLPPQYGTYSLLVFALVLHHVLSIVFLKPTVLIRPSIPPAAHTSASDSAFGWHCAL